MQNQAVRVPADRLRRATQAADRFLGTVAQHWRAADIPEGQKLLDALRRALRIAPNTWPRRVLIDKGKRSAQALSRAIREMRRAEPTIHQASVAPPALKMPDAAPLRAPDAPVRYTYHMPEGPVEPAPRQSENYWHKVYHRQQGTLDQFMASRRKARKAYNATGAGTVSRRKYLASAKGKAMRKAANARYYAKRKEKGSHHD